MLLALPPLDAGLALDIERARHLLAAGEIDAETAGWLIERAHNALEAELERREQPRTRHDCRLCGGVGSSPTHRPDCPYYRIANRESGRSL